MNGEERERLNREMEGGRESLYVCVCVYSRGFQGVAGVNPSLPQMAVAVFDGGMVFKPISSFVTTIGSVSVCVCVCACMLGCVCVY